MGSKSKIGLPRLLDRRPCEGLAEVSLIAAEDHRTTVMATPLYVRVRQLPTPNTAIKGRGRSLRSLLKLDLTLRRSALEPASGLAFLPAPSDPPGAASRGGHSELDREPEMLPLPPPAWQVLPSGRRAPNWVAGLDDVRHAR
jgi:hypothetical protein